MYLPVQRKTGPALFRVVVRHDALVGVIVALMAYALEHQHAARTRRQREALLRDDDTARWAPTQTPQ